jgi:predicted outer membrane repeat protein
VFEPARKSIIASFVASLFGLGLLISLFTLGAGSIRASTPLYVDDDTCPNVGTGTAGDPYCSIQSAVDAAPDFGEIRVAAGTYTGTQKVEAENGYVYTQVVLIDRQNITVTGGYDSGDWSAGPDPVANPTIVDAERSGRGFTVLGQASQVVTLDGLTVTGGDYSGSGNPSGQGNKVCTGTAYDCGGGLRAENVRLILRDMTVYDNIAGRVGQDRSSQGGGMDTRELQPGSLIENSKFISNTAGGKSGYGGGLHLNRSEVVIRDSLFEKNYAARSGGGLMIHIISPVKLEGTSFKDNLAEDNGGAIFTEQGYCDLKEEYLVMDGGYLTGNQAWAGAAMMIKQSRSWGRDCGATLTNLILAKNKTEGSSTRQAVINVANFKEGYPLVVNHLTAADNEATTFLHLQAGKDSQVFTATVNNTLVLSSSIGIAGEQISGTLTIDVNNPLFHNVSDEFHVQSGAPVFDVSNQVTGDPRLDNTYHLGWGSAAIDEGIDVGVYHDIDGDSRLASPPDIGADERQHLVHVPFVVK